MVCGESVNLHILNVKFGVYVCIYIFFFTKGRARIHSIHQVLKELHSLPCTIGSLSLN